MSLNAVKCTAMHLCEHFSFGCNLESTFNVRNECSIFFRAGPQKRCKWRLRVWFVLGDEDWKQVELCFSRLSSKVGNYWLDYKVYVGDREDELRLIRTEKRMLKDAEGNEHVSSCISKRQILGILSVTDETSNHDQDVDERLQFTKASIILNISVKAYSDTLSGFVPSPFDDLLPIDMTSLLEDISNQDFRIKVKGKTLLVHKTVLIARSKVFASMFRPEMNSEDLVSIDLSDYEVEMVDEILFYIYTGKIVLRCIPEALSLYKVAETYALEGLKDACSKFCTGNLTADYVLDVLKFAREICNVDIERVAKQFVISSSNAVLKSEKWNTFISENCDLATDLLRAITSKVISL